MVKIVLSLQRLFEHPGPDGVSNKGRCSASVYYCRLIPGHSVSVAGLTPNSVWLASVPRAYPEDAILGVRGTPGTDKFCCILGHMLQQTTITGSDTRKSVQSIACGN